MLGEGRGEGVTLYPVGRCERYIPAGSCGKGGVSAGDIPRDMAGEVFVSGDCVSEDCGKA